MDAYINILYFKNKILIDYHLSKSDRQYSKSSGISLISKNINEADKKLLNLISDSPENKIILTSKDKLKLEDCVKLTNNELKKIKHDLKNKRPDINFILRT